VSERLYKSKSLATWIALVGGSLGLHRFYLHGFRDPWGWLFFPPTLLGLYGVQRARELGQDDGLSWVLIPILGVMLATTMLTAIIYGLTSDERWDARHNPDMPPQRTTWAPVLGAVLGLFVGAAVLMATVAYSSQRYFEHQVERAAQKPS
jgi:heme/copper-type cytochrome/quinol oxidase subunit 1